MHDALTYFKRNATVILFSLILAITFGSFGHGKSTNDPRTPLFSFASLSAQAQTAEPLIATGAALDVHTHIASQTLTDLFTGGGVPAAGADDLVARLDEANVQRAIILSAAGTLARHLGFVMTSMSSPRTTTSLPKWRSTPTG